MTIKNSEGDILIIGKGAKVGDSQFTSRQINFIKIDDGLMQIDFDFDNNKQIQQVIDALNKLIKDEIMYEDRIYK